MEEAVSTDKDKVEATVKFVMERINLEGIPEYMHDGIRLYVERGILPGSFLTAVFENDFMQACACADQNNQRCLWHYGAMLYSVPMNCKGDIEAVMRWVEMGGIRGSFDG